MTLKLNGTNSEAAPAYAGDDADTGLQCGTNELKLVTGGTARATVDSSGNLGIGTASPGSFNSDGRNLVVGTGSGGQGMSIYSGNSSYGTIYFADGTSGDALYQGGVLYNHASNFMRLDTAGAERLRILSDGTIRLASGCPGIDFSQIQTNASGMTSETLDSYEEGTWTPSNANVTYTNVFGWYTKVGNTVHTWGRVSIPTNTSSSNFQITGLPFTIKSSLYAGGVAISNMGNDNIFPMYNQGDTRILVRNGFNNNYTLSSVSGKFLYFHGSYQV